MEGQLLETIEVGERDKGRKVRALWRNWMLTTIYPIHGQVFVGSVEAVLRRSALAVRSKRLGGLEEVTSGRRYIY
jgi:hypothetical protein